MNYYEDLALNKLILTFGGSHDTNSVLPDTWLFSGNPGAWALCSPTICLPPPDGPEARCCYGLTYDSMRRKIVMFGGQLPPKPHAFKDMWSWTFAGGWFCESPLSCNIETPP
jgi:hypothetical protein